MAMPPEPRFPKSQIGLFCPNTNLKGPASCPVPIRRKSWLVYCFKFDLPIAIT